MLDRMLVSSTTYVDLHDHPYNDNAWVTEVREKIKKKTFEGAKVVLVGFRKDSSSYYQSLFPEWDYVELPSQYGTFNATDIRRQYFQDSPIISEFLDPDVREWLKGFVFRDTFKWLTDETKYLVEYAKEWGHGPFVTVDAVCVQAGHVLLVTRKDHPYKGALAIPGGFLNPNERILDACLRELREETHVSDSKGEIPPGMLKSFITRNKVYDAPERSQRGRVITHAYKFEFPNRTSGLYKVTGDDDAEKAQWYSLSELLPDMFMDDHADIIQDLTGVKF
jgi:bifunctional NMN adenylyltransferase/nudix hydrolase